MIPALINGEFRQSISVFDRGFHYGDGLFETIAVKQGKPLLWQQHMQRLQAGATQLKLHLPDSQLLYREALHLIQQSQQSQFVLKIMISRNNTGRAYYYQPESLSQRVLLLFPWPQYPASYQQQGVKLRFCHHYLSPSPLAGIKHLNRLDQVIARNEWQDASIAEGIVLDNNGNVVEATMSNIFAISAERVIVTPDLTQCGIAGVMRAWLLAYIQQQAWSYQITTLKPSQLKTMQEVFLCNSIIGIWPVTQIEDWHYTIGDMTLKLLQAVAQIN